MIEDKDESQKSAQGNPGASGALTERLEPRSGAPLKDEGSHPVSNPHPDSSTPQSLSPPEPCTSPVWGPGVSAQVQEPLRYLLRPAEHRSVPLPFVTGVPGAHLGAGAGPIHRPEQQERQPQQAGGAGHSGALRTGS